jgi:hypothetical protein
MADSSYMKLKPYQFIMRPLNNVQTYIEMIKSFRLSVLPYF